MDKNIGKVVLISLPNNKRPKYRWIIKKREDDRYVTRVPKVGVLLKNLKIQKLNLNQKLKLSKRKKLNLNQKINLFP